MRDYYRDMDLSVNATQDEIKGQYRRLAKQFHPDRNPNNPQAEQRFKEVNEAYRVLSDESARIQYDFKREANYRQQRQNNTGGRKKATSKGFNDFFESELWGAVRGFAGNVAQDFVRNLDQEIWDEGGDVDPIVERLAKVTAKHNPSGSVSVNVTISKENLREITAMASRGMDIEQFSADVGILVASSLADAIMDKWRY
jgi:curved DNA-binding protein CbpA